MRIEFDLFVKFYYLIRHFPRRLIDAGLNLIGSEFETRQNLYEIVEIELNAG